MYPTNPTPNTPKEPLMTLVKENLVQSLYDQAGLSKQQSKALVDNVFELIKKSLESGDDVLISGFGKFMVKEKAQRKGRNPETGDDLTIEARKVVNFRCSPVLRDKINAAD
jgi:integration host factor subunit alpha